MAIIYAPTGETFQGGVNNVYFNGTRQCHIGILSRDCSSEVGIAYDCNTACVIISGLSAQITDWALENCWSLCGCGVRMIYRWNVSNSGGTSFCDTWTRDSSDKRLVYTVTNYFRPSVCFCACIYGYGCSPRHFVAPAPFGSCNYVTCFCTGEAGKNIYFECSGGWSCTDWQIISCYEADCLANVGWRPQMNVYSNPAYGVTTCVRGKNPDGSYYYCSLNSTSGSIVLDH